MDPVLAGGWPETRPFPEMTPARAYPGTQATGSPSLARSTTQRTTTRSVIQEPRCRSQPLLLPGIGAQPPLKRMGGPQKASPGSIDVRSCQADRSHSPTGAPLVKLPLGHALEHPGCFGQQVSTPASEFL
jgi:hypothetical protein